MLIGTTGSGKTYKFTQLLQVHRRVILIDPTGDEKLESYGVLCEDVESVKTLAVRSDKFRIRVCFGGNEKERFDACCKIAYELGNCIVAIDEAALYCSPHFISDGFESCVRLGRHRNVGVILTTQRPADINSLILSQSKQWYIFQMHLPRDIQYLRQFVPGIEHCMRLPQGEYLLWQPEIARSLLKESKSS